MLKLKISKYFLIGSEYDLQRCRWHEKKIFGCSKIITGSVSSRVHRNPQQGRIQGEMCFVIVKTTWDYVTESLQCIFVSIQTHIGHWPMRDIRSDPERSSFLSEFIPECHSRWAKMYLLDEVLHHAQHYFWYSWVERSLSEINDDLLNSYILLTFIEVNLHALWYVGV